MSSLGLRPVTAVFVLGFGLSGQGASGFGLSQLAWSAQIVTAVEMRVTAVMRHRVALRMGWSLKTIKPKPVAENRGLVQGSGERETDTVDVEIRRTKLHSSTRSHAERT